MEAGLLGPGSEPRAPGEDPSLDGFGLGPLLSLCGDHWVVLGFLFCLFLWGQGGYLELANRIGPGYW